MTGGKVKVYLFFQTVQEGKRLLDDALSALTPLVSVVTQRSAFLVSSSGQKNNGMLDLISDSYSAQLSILQDVQNSPANQHGMLLQMRKFSSDKALQTTVDVSHYAALATGNILVQILKRKQQKFHTPASFKITFQVQVQFCGAGRQMGRAQ